MMGGNSAEKESLASISSTSTLVTRSRAEEKFGVGTPSSCFLYHGVKCWNTTSKEVKDTKMKCAAEKAVKEYICYLPM
jgi:hypothetical protein